ncbi:hypothetical protein SDC9_138720 [bioreactor metagenome]|uniref:Uncharacterized protein n=1 Tax=bioreactor metagenome TaxID=1076179 RepID=A0A645DQR1_9ZZZZ
MFKAMMEFFLVFTSLHPPLIGLLPVIGGDIQYRIQDLGLRTQISKAMVFLMGQLLAASLWPLALSMPLASEGDGEHGLTRIFARC